MRRDAIRRSDAGSAQRRVGDKIHGAAPAMQAPLARRGKWLRFSLMPNQGQPCDEEKSGLSPALLRTFHWIFQIDLGGLALFALSKYLSMRIISSGIENVVFPGLGVKHEIPLTAARMGPVHCQMKACAPRYGYGRIRQLRPTHDF
jgi:hypothetical protein